MRSRIGRVGVRGRLALRRLFLVALALVVALLAGGIPARQALAQTSSVELNVNFSPQTPPLPATLDICIDQPYLIEVRPVVPVGEGIGPVPLFGGEIISMTRPQWGTLNGTKQPVGRMVDAGGAAIFTYKAERRGQEVLTFGVLRHIDPQVMNDPDYSSVMDHVRTQILTSHLFIFGAVECHFKVSLLVTWNYSVGGIYVGAFATTAETTLDRQPDGTFQGANPIKFTYVASLGVCSADYSGFSAPTRITGKIQAGDGDLELNFEFGPAQSSAAFSCDGLKKTGSRNEDVAKYVGVTKATFPQEGDIQSFPTPGEGQGQFTVSVRPITAAAQK